MYWVFIATVIAMQSFSATGSKQMVLHGKIKLDKGLGSLPQESCLLVKFEDTNLADAPSVLIASRVFKNSDLKLMKDGIPYNMTFKKPDVRRYTVSATLNVGWCANGGRKWLHNGDYLTTTDFGVKVTDEKDVYSEDVDMEYYRSAPSNVHHPKRVDPCVNAPCMNSICRSFSNGSYSCIEVSDMPCAMPACFAFHDPICASNGKTYDNECMMMSDACHDGVQITLRKVHDGECYSKHPMLGGVLFSTCIILLTILGFISIFWVWRRNRKIKMEQQLGAGSMKKVAPLGI